MPDTLTPRPYQEEDLDAIEAEYREGNTRLLYHAATGLGKGVLATFLPQRFERLFEEGMLMLVPRREIAFQMQDNLSRALPSATVGLEMGGSWATGNEDVLIMSIHTAGRRSSDRIERFLRNYGIIVNDEAHHSYRGGIADNVLSWFGQSTEGRSVGGVRPLVLHMTATPHREDEHSLAPFIDAVAASRDITFGVRQGWLVDIRSYKVIEELEGGGVDDMDGYEADLIVRAYEKYGLGLSTLVYAGSLDVAHLATRRFSERGVEAAYIDGETDKERRDERLRQFRNGEVQVMTNFNCLSEGFDFPGLQCEIMARPLQSERLYTQMMGRALRPACNVDEAGSAEARKERIAASEKPFAHIIDVAHNTDRLSLQTTAPSVIGVPEGAEDAVGVGDGDASLVTEVKDVIDELEEEQPERDLREADPNEIDLAIRRVDVWSQTVYNEQIEEVTPLRWIKSGDPPSYSLYLPEDPNPDSWKDQDPKIVRIEPQEGGDAYDVYKIGEGGWTKNPGGRDFAKPANVEHVQSIDTQNLTIYMKNVEQKIARENESVYRALRRDMISPNETPGSKTLDKLRRRGYRVDEDRITKLTARLLLDHAKIENKVDAIRRGEQGTEAARKTLS
jgi:superfamily II DNA or RNA helicase